MANKYTDRELLDFNYKQSDKVNLAEQQKAAAEQALKNYGGYNFNYGRQADYDKAMDAILNRKKFSYDLNGDMLYQQYKDNYINQGKLAMMDTMGQASAMTGGYGNSYAATVGNQAYQSHLQGLNNIIPDLYALALQSYNAEGDRLATNLNALGSDRQLAQSEYDTKYNADMSRLTADRDYHTTNYNNERSFDYGSQYDSVNANNEAYWNEYNAGYQAEQDAIANALNERQVKASEAAAAAADKSAWYEANWINPDDVEVDDNGNIISINGNSVAGNNEGDLGDELTAKSHSGVSVSGFKTNTGDNFKINIDGKNYRVENDGKVNVADTINKLDEIGSSDGTIMSYGGKLYYKESKGNYYKIDSTEVGFEKFGFNTAGYKNALKALGLSV